MKSRPAEGDTPWLDDPADKISHVQPNRKERRRLASLSRVQPVQVCSCCNPDTGLTNGSTESGAEPKGYYHERT